MKPIRLLQLGGIDFLNGTTNNIKNTFIKTVLITKFLKVQSEVKGVYNVYLVKQNIDKSYLNLICFEQNKVLYDSEVLDRDNINFFRSIAGIDIKGMNNNHIINLILMRFFNSGSIDGYLMEPNLIYSQSGHGENIGREKFVRHMHLNENDILSWDMKVDPIEVPLEIWLEYKKDSVVNIEFVVTFISVLDKRIIEERIYSEKELQSSIILEAKNDQHWLNVFFKLRVKGEGIIEVGNLCLRPYHGKPFELIPGAERLVDSNREEIFAYFNKGNMKPPLNVFFSGYHNTNTFEGYPSMRRTEHPFILLSDIRLFGGKFYLSKDHEIENEIINYIRSKLKELNFKANDLNLTGISMGSTGAIYYASALQPKNVIVGKAILDVKLMADNTKLKKTDSFQTSLDIVNSLGVTKRQQFMNMVKPERLINTHFYMAYMKQDDYEDTAYDVLKEQLNGKVKLTAIGFEGHHGDKDDRIIEWFFEYLKEAMSDWDGVK